MSLCRLVVLDFMHGVGRIDEETGDVRYDRYDLTFARNYADNLMTNGYIFDPIDGFRLEDFAAWCRTRLRGSVCSPAERRQRRPPRRAG